MNKSKKYFFNLVKTDIKGPGQGLVGAQINNSLSKKCSLNVAVLVLLQSYISIQLS